MSPGCDPCLALGVRVGADKDRFGGVTSAPAAKATRA
jgi:hypothetical protein